MRTYVLRCMHVADVGPCLLIRAEAERGESRRCGELLAEARVGGRNRAESDSEKTGFLFECADTPCASCQHFSHTLIGALSLSSCSLLPALFILFRSPAVLSFHPHLLFSYFLHSLPLPLCSSHIWCPSHFWCYSPASFPSNSLFLRSSSGCTTVEVSTMTARNSIRWCCSLYLTSSTCTSTH